MTFDPANAVTALAIALGVTWKIVIPEIAKMRNGNGSKSVRIDQSNGASLELKLKDMGENIAVDIATALRPHFDANSKTMDTMCNTLSRQNDALTELLTRARMQRERSAD